MQHPPHNSNQFVSVCLITCLHLFSLTQLHSQDGDDGHDEPESRKRKDMRESLSERDEEGNSCKKPRVVWSVEMHQQFVQAVNQLGIDSKWGEGGLWERGVGTSVGGDRGWDGGQ